MNAPCKECGRPVEKVEAVEMPTLRLDGRRTRERANGRFVVEPMETRFWKKVRKTDSCWVWVGARGYDMGYGRFAVSMDEKQQMAHRVSWVIANGAIPTGLVVMHECDNPPCVRPDHLRLGTIADNNEDRDRKDRGAVGVRNAAAKLTPEQVRAILTESGRYKDIGRRHGVSTFAVGRIKRRQGWQSVIGGRA